jgi:hypothetical protein
MLGQFRIVGKMRQYSCYLTGWNLPRRAYIPGLSPVIIQPDAGTLHRKLPWRMSIGGTLGRTPRIFVP